MLQFPLKQMAYVKMLTFIKPPDVSFRSAKIELVGQS